MVHKIRFYAVKLCLVLAVLTALLIHLSPRGVSAQGSTVRIRTEPPVLDVGVGQVETLLIVLEDAVGVYGIDLRARFDPSAVEVVDLDIQKDGVQMAPGTFLKADFMVINLADNEAGTLQYVVTQVNPTEPATGTGVVLEIQFRGKKQGANSGFEFVAVDIADRKGIKLANQPEDGGLKVVAPKPPTPAPTVTEAELPTPTQNVEATITPETGPQTGQTPPTTQPADQTLLWAGIILAGGLLSAAVVTVTAALILMRRRMRRKKM